VNQKGYIRHTCSRNWIYQGYRNDWLALCSQYDYNFEKIGAEWHTFLLNHTPDTPKVIKKKPSPSMTVLDSHIPVEIPYIFGKAFEFPKEKDARLERRKKRDERKRLKLLDNEETMIEKSPKCPNCDKLMLKVGNDYRCYHCNGEFLSPETMQEIERLNVYQVENDD
jgi:hypothetical protein